MRLEGLHHVTAITADAPRNVDFYAGTLGLRFVADNDLGVLDHDVTLPDGAVVRNPFRVLPNDRGSEAVFTVFRRDGMDAAAFEADAVAVRADLERLRTVLEA